jgi:flagellar motility protein MotE (MotC chaperone)
MRIRVLTVIIISSALLLLVKVIDLYERKQNIISAILSEPSIAKESGSAEPQKEGDKEKKEDGDKKKGEPEPPKVSEEKVVSFEEQQKFSDVEIDILQRLSERKEKLSKWEKDLQVRENVLNITEEKINNKITEMRDLKKQVEKALEEYNKKEDEKIQNLVKIYENMKPQDAADIFSKMDILTVSQIVSKMKEKSAALVLAKMEPKIAKDVTNKIAALGRLEKSPVATN